MDKEVKNFEAVLAETASIISFSEDKTERVKKLQLEAITMIYKYLCHYKDLGYVDSLLDIIASKKAELLFEISSKNEMEKLVKPRCPHYDGSKFIEDKYIIPEEELICWSQTSLEAPLNEIGFKRYMKLIKRCFPEDYERIIKQEGEK